MATHSLIALKAFSYAGKPLKVGDKFTAEGDNAKLLVAIKKAKLDEAATPPPPTPPSPKPAPTPPAPKSTAVGGMTTRSYKTRDVKPE